jgi:sec-independent protein translocase protein TatA
MEIVLLGLLAVLLFGAKNLPEIGRSVGRGMKDFKDSIDGTGVKDAFDGVNEVRSAVSPANMARAFVPGLADTQDAVAAAKGSLNPAESLATKEGTAAAGDAAPASPAPDAQAPR